MSFVESYVLKYPHFRSGYLPDGCGLTKTLSSQAVVASHRWRDFGYDPNDMFLLFRSDRLTPVCTHVRRGECEENREETPYVLARS